MFIKNTQTDAANYVLLNDIKQLYYFKTMFIYYDVNIEYLCRLSVHACTQLC